MGIHFDNEGVGNLKNIVASMQAASQSFSPPLKLAFTNGIIDCKHKQIHGVDFDYCLGQSYTDCTSDIYSSSESWLLSTDKLFNTWDGIVPNLGDGYSVPMLCGGVNCQGDLFCCLKGNPKSVHDCNIDERL